MLRVELAEKIIEYLGFSCSMIHRAINANVLETVSDDRVFSDYKYAITRSSFHNYLYKLGLSEREIDSIMASF